MWAGPRSTAARFWSRRTTFVANDVLTLYFDAVLSPAAGGWEWTNQLFYEAYDNLNENAYGFSQFHDTWVIEDKLVAANSWRTGGATVSVQLSPSLRYTNFDHGDDYTNEYFDRRDLTRPPDRWMPGCWPHGSTATTPNTTSATTSTWGWPLPWRT